MSWQRLNIGSRVTREGHARFWERPEVKFLGATRQSRNQWQRIMAASNAWPHAARAQQDLVTTDRTLQPGPERGPLGRRSNDLPGGAQSSPRPDAVRDNRCDYEVHEGRT
jgi:hypothetical protein